MRFVYFVSSSRQHPVALFISSCLLDHRLDINGHRWTIALLPVRLPRSAMSRSVPGTLKLLGWMIYDELNWFRVHLLAFIIVPFM